VAGKFKASEVVVDLYYKKKGGLVTRMRQEQLVQQPGQQGEDDPQGRAGRALDQAPLEKEAGPGDSLEHGERDEAQEAAQGLRLTDSIINRWWGPDQSFFSFDSMLIILLFVICTASYVRAVQPQLFPRKRPGFLGIVRSAAVIGDRLSPAVALACAAMALFNIIYR
jgi:hypothetical protein